MVVFLNEYDFVHINDVFYLFCLCLNYLTIIYLLNFVDYKTSGFKMAVEYCQKTQNALTSTF